MRDIVIIQTGIANIASVRASFERLSVRVTLTHDPELVRHASHVMLPGVGAFGAGMAALHSSGLSEALVERLGNDRPTMAICLGLQLLAVSSEETPGIVGLSIFEQSHVTRFDSNFVKVPQLGWNKVDVESTANFLQRGYAYFANSFRLVNPPPGWTAAYADHGGRFVAALERGPHLACQFHPELSGPWGQALIARWLGLGGGSC